MSSKDAWRTFSGLILLFALLFLPKLVWGESVLYTEILTAHALLAVAAPIKLAMLCLAAILAWLSARALGPDNPAHMAWVVLAGGLAFLSIGQACLATYQVVLVEETPFPSVADAPFVLGTILLIAALVAFVVVYQRSGLAMASGREILATVTVGAVPALIVVVVVLFPIARAEAPWGEKLLNLGYPLMDLCMLLPAAVLLRSMLKLRGGHLWLVWARLLAAIFFLAVGDVLYAYFTTLGFAALDPLLDLTFAYAYILFAWGAQTQHELVRG